MTLPGCWKSCNGWAKASPGSGFSALRLDFMMELQYLQNLSEESPNPTVLTGDYWDEVAALADLRSQANHAFQASYHVLKAHLAYLHHDYAVALQHVEAGRRGFGSLCKHACLLCLVGGRFVGPAGRGALGCPLTGAEDCCGRSLQTRRAGEAGPADAGQLRALLHDGRSRARLGDRPHGPGQDAFRGGP